LNFSLTCDLTGLLDFSITHETRMRGAASSMKSLRVEQPVERSWRRRAGFARKRKRSRNRACCSLPMQTSGGLGDGVVSDTSPLVLSCMVLDEGVADVG
jgi:hypothetical protein